MYLIKCIQYFFISTEKKFQEPEHASFEAVFLVTGVEIFCVVSRMCEKKNEIGAYSISNNAFQRSFKKILARLNVDSAEIREVLISLNSP